MSNARVVRPKAIQSILRNNGGVIGAGSGPGGLDGGGDLDEARFLLSPPPPLLTAFLVPGFFGLLLLILGIWFGQKMKDELSRSEHGLSIQKCDEEYCGRFG